jgi:hypothetical protein
MAQRSEDGVGKTREMTRRLERAISGWTRPAISIQASSRDDWLHQQTGHTEAPEPAQPNLSNTPLYPKGRPHTVVRGQSRALHPQKFNDRQESNPAEIPD